MEPAQPKTPQTTALGTPDTPGVVSSSAEPRTVTPPVGESGVVVSTDATQSQGGIRSTLSKVFGGGSDVAEPAAQASDQTVEAASTPVIPAAEAAWPVTDSTEGTPGIAPRRDTDPAQTQTTPVASTESTGAWVAPTEPGNPQPVTPDVLVITPTPEPLPTPVKDQSAPVIEGVDPAALKAAAEADFKRLAGDTAEGNAEASAPTSDIADMTEMANKIRAAEGQAPLDLKLSGPDSSALLQSYILHGLTEGLSNDLSKLPLRTRISVLMAANRIARGMGEKGGITLSQEQVDNFLETARQNGTIPSAQPTTTETTPTDPTIATAQPEFTPAISPTPDLTTSTEPSSLGSTPPATKPSAPLT